MKEILDIGAGRDVALGATRAIDVAKPYYEKTGGIVRPKSLHEYRCARAEKIPYPDGFFNKVVSRWALGPRIFRRKAYLEIARVLKPNGRVEVRILWQDRRYRQRVIDRLGEVGILVYAEYKGIYTKPGFQRTEFVICGRLNGLGGDSMGCKVAHRGAKYRTWRNTVLRTGENKCSLCGSKKDLTADHIKPIATHPKLMFDPSNGRVLCNACRVKDMLEGWANKRFKSVGSKGG